MRYDSNSIRKVAQYTLKAITPPAKSIDLALKTKTGLLLNNLSVVIHSIQIVEKVCSCTEVSKKSEIELHVILQNHVG